MKVFNLEEYLKNPSKKVVTRDGRKVRILCSDFNNPDFPVICGVESSTNEQLCSFTKDGSYFIGASSPCDLCFAPEKHEGWVNVYRDFDDMMCGSVFATEEDAKHNAKTAIATVKIDWEE